ncbi:MAG: phosphatidate cytidylyltransferase [Gemmatimonadetes bacterium]|nr:phosphatidate cytidylyltransferase [Gemmatimonadota bacterium]
MSTLGLRVATSALLVPLFVATILIGGIVFLAAVLVLTLVGTLELFLMARDKPYRARFVPGIGLALTLPVLLYRAPHDPLALTALLIAAVIGIATAQMLDPSGSEALASAAFTLFGAVYVGLLFAHLILIREIAREAAGLPVWSGAVLLGLPLLLTWINDTAAYFVGRRWGRRRLLPRVSPGKSLEGAVGAGLITIGAALVAVPGAGHLVPVFETADAVALGVLIAVAAPCGDLIESAFKRDAGVKDVSRLVPGHGGVLDRFDSVLVTVPLTYYYLKALVL